RAVAYPSDRRSVAIVSSIAPKLREASYPPQVPRFPYTPVVNEYLPVNVVTRLGQHRGLDTNELVNDTPEALAMLRSSGLYTGGAVSHRWSSVMMITMFGLVGASAARAPCGDDTTVAAVSTRKAAARRDTHRGWTRMTPSRCITLLR